jgi:hypothetical protein
VSLSRVCQQQSKRAQARQLLADIYGWFTDGFDTADLQESQGVARRVVMILPRLVYPASRAGETEYPAVFREALVKPKRMEAF